jgi:FAD dependent oxidoreductase
VDMAARRTIGKERLPELMASAAADGYDLPRHEGSDHVTPIDGVTATIMTRLDQVRRDPDGRIRNATDPEILTELEIAGRRQALEYARFLVDRVPGYERASLVALGTRVGVRETRRVYGDDRVTGEDVLAARQFEDQIGLCGAPIEDHHGSEADGADGTTWRYLPDGAAVGIPLRSLIVRDGANTLVAGRCFSATHDAHASIRSMAQCMAMGQAAGTVAAMAVGRGGEVRAVPVDAVLARLRDDGAVLHVPEPDRVGP